MRKVFNLGIGVALIAHDRRQGRAGSAGPQGGLCPSRDRDPRVMARLAVFASGRGSNFVAIAEAMKDTRHRLEFLLCDVASAPVLDRAQELGVPTVPVSYVGATKENVEKKIVRHLERRQVDIVALAGFMKLLSPWFLDAFKGPVINIHPSLLPRYPGVHGIDESFDSGDPELGMTIMRVDAGIDTVRSFCRNRFTACRGKAGRTWSAGSTTSSTNGIRGCSFRCWMESTEQVDEGARHRLGRAGARHRMEAVAELRGERGVHRPGQRGHG